MSLVVIQHLLIVNRHHRWSSIGMRLNRLILPWNNIYIVDTRRWSSSVIIVLSILYLEYTNLYFNSLFLYLLTLLTLITFFSFIFMRRGAWEGVEYIFLEGVKRACLRARDVLDPVPFHHLLSSPVAHTLRILHLPCLPCLPPYVPHTPLHIFFTYFTYLSPSFTYHLLTSLTLFTLSVIHLPPSLFTLDYILWYFYYRFFIIILPLYSVICFGELFGDNLILFILEYFLFLLPISPSFISILSISLRFYFGFFPFALLMYYSLLI
jgi:hypothetical protein